MILLTISILMIAFIAFALWIAAACYLRDRKEDL